MVQYKILHICCSQQDAVAIRTRIRTIKNIQANITVFTGKQSLEKIIKQLKKSRKLQQQDYIFAIDHKNSPIFMNDYTPEMLFHFQDISAFFHWIDAVF